MSIVLIGEVSLWVPLGANEMIPIIQMIKNKNELENLNLNFTFNNKYNIKVNK